MKQNIDINQVQKFIKSEEDIIKLGKVIRTDYEGAIKGYILFDKLKPQDAVKEVCKGILEDYTIGKMFEILQRKEIKIVVDNCIPATVKDITHNKEYCEMELCDALWTIVLDNLEK